MESEQLKEEKNYYYGSDKIVLFGRELGTAEIPKQWEGKFYFDEEEARRATDFIENYIHHVEGALAGRKFILEPWQKCSIREIFGMKKVGSNKRKYKRVYFFLPRKNGKSAIASAIALYLLICDGEMGAQIYSAAADREQAAIVFEVAQKMLEYSPELSDLVEVFKKSIVDYDTGSSYKVLSADVKNKHGKNSHGILFDELHTQPKRDLWDTLCTSISARSQPLILAMTTAGYDQTSICYEVHDYAIGVRDGDILDDQFLPILYLAEDTDDWTKEETWYKANPNLGVSKSVDYMREECERAKNSPMYENTFRRLELNQWTQQATRFIQMNAWKKCGGVVDLDALKEKPCWMGLDLSSNRDLTAACLVFPRDSKSTGVKMEDFLLNKNPDEHAFYQKYLKVDTDGFIVKKIFDVAWWFWMPEEMARVRMTQGTTHAAKSSTKEARARYSEWIRQKYITTTSGNVIDYGEIFATILRIRDTYNLQQVALDPWNSTQISTQLMEEDINVLQFRQGYHSMNEPTKFLDSCVLSQSLNHGDNPVATWMASNLAVETDSSNNVKPTKEKSSGKIDGIVALIMALARANLEESNSVYEQRGLITT